MLKNKGTRQKYILIFVVVILIATVLTGALIYYNFIQGKMPFEDLTEDDVKSISLYDYNGKVIYTFNDEEKAEIVELLNGIVIGKKDNLEYDGGFSPEFRMEKTDGTIVEFGTNANFWLDGQRYEVPDNNMSLIELRKLHTESFREHYVPINAQN